MTKLGLFKFTQQKENKEDGEDDISNNGLNHN
jgi:hypothetical protein